MALIFVWDKSLFNCSQVLSIRQISAISPIAISLGFAGSSNDPRNKLRACVGVNLSFGPITWASLVVLSTAAFIASQGFAEPNGASVPPASLIFLFR